MIVGSAKLDHCSMNDDVVPTLVGEGQIYHLLVRSSGFRIDPGVALLQMTSANLRARLPTAQEANAAQTIRFFLKALI
jgi:hypothetical protein